VRDKLEEGMQNLQGESDNRWSRTLKEEAKNIELNMSVSLGDVNISVEDLMAMKKGDILPIEMPKQVSVRAEDIALMRGKLGQSHDKKAVKIEEILRHPAYQEPSVRNIKEWLNE